MNLFAIAAIPLSSPTAPGIFRSFKACTDAKERVGCGNQWEATAPIYP